MLTPGVNLPAGQVVDVWPELLKEQLQSVTDEDLWVITANAQHERAWGVPAYGGSVFSRAIVAGFAGNADQNQDRTIDLEEFYQYVFHFTDSAVKNASAEAVSQSPQLLRAGSYPPSSPFPLLCAAGGIDVQKLVAEANADQQAKEKAADTPENATGDSGAPADASSNTPTGSATTPIDLNSGSDSTSDDPSTASQAKSERVDPTLPLPLGGIKWPESKLLAQEAPEPKELVALAWELHDAWLQDANSPAAQLIVQYPVHYRAWLDLIRDTESSITSANTADQVLAAQRLRAELLGLKQWTTGENVQSGTVFRRLSSPSQTELATRWSRYSLSIAEEINRRDPAPTAAMLKTFGGFRQAVETSPEALKEWLQSPESAVTNQSYEFWLASELMSRSAMPWELAKRQQSVQRRLYSRLADARSTSPQGFELLQRAERLRVEAYRISIEQINDDWQTVAQQLLDQTEHLIDVVEQSQSIFAQLEFDATILSAETQQLMALLPVLANHSLGREVETECQNAIMALNVWREWSLGKPSPDFDRLMGVAQQIKAASKRLKQFWSKRLFAKATTAPWSSTAWLASQLLETTLGSAVERLTLRELVLKTRQAEAFTGTPLPEARATIPNDSDLQRKLRPGVLAWTRLATSWAELQGWQPTKELTGLSEQAASTDFLKSLVAIKTSLQRFFDESRNELRTSFVQSDSAVLDGVPARLTFNTQPTRFMALHENSSGLDTERDLADVLINQDADQLFFQWQGLLRVNVADANAAEYDLISRLLNRTKVEFGTRIGNLSLAKLEPNSLRWDGPTRVNLVDTPSQQSTWNLLSNVDLSQPAWVVLEYDPALLQVSLDTREGVLRHTDLGALLRNASADAEKRITETVANGGSADEIDAIRNQLAELQSALQYPLQPLPLKDTILRPLSPADKHAFTLTLTRAAQQSRQPRLVLHAVQGTSYVRTSIAIDVPAIPSLDLAIDGLPGDKKQTDEGWTLFPWPNRESNYRMTLRQDGTLDQAVHVELLTLLERRDVQVPNRMLKAEQARVVLDALGPTTRVVKLENLTLSASGQRIEIPWLPEERPPAGAPGDNAGNAANSITQPQVQSVGQGKDDKSAETAAKKPLVESIRHGLVVIITQLSTGEQLMRRIDFRPRHPRSYVTASVGYDRTKELVSIQVSAKNAKELPDKGIPVQAEYFPALQGSAASTAVTLTPQSPIAKMFTTLPSQAGQNATLWLHIDGFPRALTFSIPLDHSNYDIAEDRHRTNLQVLSPQPGSPYAAPVEKLPVRLRVDAPAGAFESIRDRLEVGFDVDRDREFASEQPVVLMADRQADISLLSFQPRGVLSFNSRVQDWEIDVPGRGLQNVRVNVLARLAIGPEVAWSEPTEIILDGKGPEIEDVRLKSTQLVADADPIRVEVDAADDGLTGVAAVEFGFDTKGTGEFIDQPAPILALAMWTVVGLPRYLPKVCCPELRRCWSVRKTTPVTPVRIIAPSSVSNRAPKSRCKW